MASNTSNYQGIPLYDVLSKLIPGGVALLLGVALLPVDAPVTSAIRGAGSLGVVAAIPVAYAAGVALQGFSGAALPRTQLFQQRMHAIRTTVWVENRNALGDTVDSSDTVELSDDGEFVDRIVWADIVRRFELPTSFLYRKNERKPRPDSSKPLLYRLLFGPILALLDWVSVIDLGDLDHAGVNYGAEQRGFRLARARVQRGDGGRVQRFSSLHVLNRNFVVLALGSFVTYTFAALATWYFQYEPLVGPAHFSASIAALSVCLVPVFYGGKIRYDEAHDKELIYSYYASIKEDGAVGIEPRESETPTRNQPPRG